MDPQSGNWIGKFTTDGGTAVYILLDLTFTAGTIKGSFKIAPQTAGVWKGPRHGDDVRGTYTAAGTVDMNEASGHDTASFTGVYAVNGDSQVIQGNVVIKRGNEKQIGTLIVYSAEELVVHGEIPAHVWDP